MKFSVLSDLVVFFRNFEKSDVDFRFLVLIWSLEVPIDRVCLNPYKSITSTSFLIVFRMFSKFFVNLINFDLFWSGFLSIFHHHSCLTCNSSVLRYPPISCLNGFTSRIPAFTCSIFSLEKSASPVYSFFQIFMGPTQSSAMWRKFRN